MSDGKIFEVMPQIAGEIGAIAKERQSTQNYQYRGIDDVYNACHGPLCNHGVFVTTEASGVSHEERQTKTGGAITYTRLMLKTTFWAQDGSSVSTTTAGEAMDSSDKSTNKAMSAALKYAFFQTFTIPLSDSEDTEQQHHELATKSAATAAPPVSTYRAPPAPANVPACPDCGAPMRRCQRKDKSGEFWGCTAWKQTGCRGILSIDAPGGDSQVAPVKKAHPASREFTALCKILHEEIGVPKGDQATADAVIRFIEPAATLEECRASPALCSKVIESIDIKHKFDEVTFEGILQGAIELSRGGA